MGEAKGIWWEKVRFLRAIGVHEEAIGKVIVEFPAFLSFSLDRKIRPVVKENFPELLLLFHVSIEKLMGNVTLCDLVVSSPGRFLAEGLILFFTKIYNVLCFVRPLYLKSMHHLQGG